MKRAGRRDVCVCGCLCMYACPSLSYLILFKLCVLCACWEAPTAATCCCRGCRPSSTRHIHTCTHTLTHTQGRCDKKADKRWMEITILYQIVK